MGERYSGKIFPQKKSGTVLVIHFESEIDRLVYHLYEVKQVPVPAFYWMLAICIKLRTSY